MGRPARTDKEGRPFVLRDFEAGDHARLALMYEDFEPKRVAQGLPPADPVPRQRWLYSVLASGSHIVVMVEGRVLGHGMLLPFEAHAAELANFLHQSIRNRGIGTALNQALLDRAREQGIHRVWLSVEPSNRGAVRSYEKVGFRRRFTTGWAPELEMEAVLPPLDDT